MTYSPTPDARWVFLLKAFVEDPNIYTAEAIKAFWYDPPKDLPYKNEDVFQWERIMGCPRSLLYGVPERIGCSKCTLKEDRFHSIVCGEALMNALLNPCDLSVAHMEALLFYSKIKAE